MNKVVSHLGNRVYAESMPASEIFNHRDAVKIYRDMGGAQGDIYWLNREQIEALRKFLREIEEGCE